MAFANPVIGTKQEEEWHELQAVLQSGILDKAPNLKHFLEYVAQQYFSGNTEPVKEYSIAVQALHRLEQFDPQSDTIVRVTAHTLRKKLEQYYAAEGADHPIQIRLPAGKYVLQFERREQVPLPAVDLVETLPPPEVSIQAPPIATTPPRSIWWYWGIPGVAGLLLLGGYLLHYQRDAPPARPDSLASAAK